MDTEPRPTSPTPEGEPILSFEEFSYRDPKRPDIGVRYDNFFAYFDDSPWGESRRKTPHYQKFASENPEMAASLCAKMKGLTEYTSEALKDFDKDLYEAYLVMRKYVSKNGDLFS